MTNSGVDALLAELSSRYGNRLTTGEALREQHANTLTWVRDGIPDAVFFAQHRDDVVDVVKACGSHKVPLIPFGAGSSLEGQVNAPSGGLSLDLSRMNAIHRVNAEDLDCELEAGVTRKQLNAYLRDTGLFFPVDPGADYATLGGMASTRASGTTSVRYGTMRDNVINVTAVMADGSVVRTAQRARKSSAGYDLTRLMVGSEGTLGVITDLTVKLYGQPETVLSAVCPFPNIEAACRSVSMAIQLGLGVARIELLDQLQVQACNAYSKLSLEETPTLFLEFHGSPVSARDQVQSFEAIAEAEGALRFDWAENPADRNRLWQARHDALWAAKALRPGADSVISDVCVPISNLAACIAETQSDIAEQGLLAPLVGHVGDGNFHLVILVDPDDPTEMAKIPPFLERLVERALSHDGTCSGEHGVGSGKLKYLEAEHGPGVGVMQAVKRALDPDNIMNPDKLVPSKLHSASSPRAA